jgi:MoxR-like ATPase
MEIKQAAENLKRVVKQATTGLVEREIVIDLIILAAVAQEHLLIIGPPGTAKSAAVRRVAASLGGNYFEYLLGRFTEPRFEILPPAQTGHATLGAQQSIS